MCSALPSSLRDQCEETANECNDGENYYAVAFDALDMSAPYYGLCFIINVVSRYITSELLQRNVCLQSSQSTFSRTVHIPFCGSFELR